MDERDLLAERFQAHRTHLRSVAYRMLGSLSEADDAVQETWLRLHRVDADDVANLGGWLTTVVARVCVDMLRSRASRREEPLEVGVLDAIDGAGVPEDEVVLADSVGLALLVVLETLTPAERLAFVLHDMFAMPFEAIAPIVDRTPAAARQLASRARRRVHGARPTESADVTRQRAVVDAFITASRGGDFDALVRVLAPDIVLHADGGGRDITIRGATNVARGALNYAARSSFARAATIDGLPGIIVAPRGKLLAVMVFTVRDGRVAALEAITRPDRLRALDITV